MHRCLFLLSLFLPFTVSAHSLQLGGQRLDIEVARDSASRQRGLMGRETLDEHGGMLFVFERSGNHCFWMRNTPLPLSAAFIDEQGRILDLVDMQPHSETLHCASGAARYGLEVNQGWFQRHGVEVGHRVGDLPSQ